MPRSFLASSFITKDEAQGNRTEAYMKDRPYSAKFLNRVRHLRHLRPSYRWLLTTLCLFADDDFETYVSVDTLVEETGLSRRTVIRGNNALRDLGYIKVTKKAIEGVRSNKHLINEEKIRADEYRGE